MDDNWGYPHGLEPYAIGANFKTSMSTLSAVAPQRQPDGFGQNPRENHPSAARFCAVLVRKNCQFEVTCVLRGNLHPTSAPNKGKWEITVT